MKRKNSVPQILPPVMFRKTVAMVSNSREGPAVTSMSYVAQAGKMMRPATMATKVSSRMTWRLSPMRVRLLSM